MTDTRGVPAAEPLSYGFFKETGIELDKRFKRYFFARIENFIADNTNLKVKHSLYDFVQNTGAVNGFHIEHNRAIETTQVIEELIAIAKDMQADLAQAEKLGLNPDEIAFYRALIQNESAVRELGDNNLRELAKYITEQLRKNTTVDWAKRDSVRARLRNLVRRALSRWKYPPDKSEEAVDLCLKQAEVLSEAWSAG